MRSKHVYPLAVLLLVAACRLPQPAPLPDGVGGCGAACQNLARLRCDGWRGSPGEDGRYGTVDDVSCQTACEEIESAPGGNMSTGCVASVAGCDLVDRCMAEEEP